MENLVGILIHSVLGAGGGYGANMAKPNGQSMIMNLILGAVGGNLGNVVGGLMGVLGDSNFSIGSIVTALAGGGVGSLIGTFLPKLLK
ncbi:MAG: hypothetical protein IPO37_23135 [Saprospiraceae bacterium]|jgi:uncharacterized membrane protein YeaQ/YmgE (transglycosylase-associated protein family)|nr:hypothetical protein [Saprospiraceae bacterium]